MRKENTKSHQALLLRGILLNEIQKKPSYASEIIKTLKCHHIWDASEQVVFKCINDLEKKELIKQVEQVKDDNRTKRIYEITRMGIIEKEFILSNIPLGFEIKNSPINVAIISKNKSWLVEQKETLSLLKKSKEIELRKSSSEETTIFIQYELDQMQIEINAIDRYFASIRSKKE